MGKITESELKKQISQKEFQNAYLIYGDETYLKDYYVSKIKSKVIPKEATDIDFRYFEGKSYSLDDILRNCELMPMTSEYRLVLVGDYPFSSTNEVKELSQYISDMPESTILIFKYDTVEFDTKKNSKFKSVENAFIKSACCVKLDRKTEYDLVKLIISGAKKREKTISQNDAKYMVSIVGSDLTTLLNELEKLCFFSENEEISKKDIDSVCVKSLQARVYDISKAILRDDYNSAYSILNTLFEQREKPIIILSVISSCFVDMYRAKLAKSSGKDLTEIFDAYRYRGREFALRNALRDCSRLSLEQLRNCVDVLNEADIKLKSTAVDAKFIIEEALVKLLVVAKEG